MQRDSYQIRICKACGLRYPLTQGHSFGRRCPVCMGETRVVLSRELALETRRNHPGTFHGKWAVIMDNIRSAWNAGSILRSADGFGFAHAFLCGITPTPENEAVRKTSLGAEDLVTWSYHKDAVKLARGIKKEGWKIFALEEHEKAIAINEASSDRLKPASSATDAALIVGNEITGIDPELLEFCDEIFFIPMRGQKKSFNAAIAFGIAAYALSAGQL